MQRSLHFGNRYSTKTFEMTRLTQSSCMQLAYACLTNANVKIPPKQHLAFADILNDAIKATLMPGSIELRDMIVQPFIVSSDGTLSAIFKCKSREHFFVKRVEIPLDFFLEATYMDGILFIVTQQKKSKVFISKEGGLRFELYSKEKIIPIVPLEKKQAGKLIRKLDRWKSEQKSKFYNSTG